MWEDLVSEAKDIEIPNFDVFILLWEAVSPL